MRAIRRLLLTVVLASMAGCKDEPKSQGTPPPPPPTVLPSANACAAGGGTVADAPSSAFFPRKVASYCIDAQSDVKSFGDKGKLGINSLCDTALDGGCEEYKKFGVSRTVIVRYVDGGGPGSVEIMLSQFKSDGAFTIFTNRLAAEIDPADAMAMKPLPAGAPGALAAMGTGKAYVWRGAYFLELTYSNDQETPEQMKKSSEVILTALAKDIGGKLPDDPAIPVSAKALPDAERLPNGVLYYPKDVMGVANAGAGAVGYYQRGTRRYRLVAAQRDDAEQAKDAFRTLKARAGAMPVANLADDASFFVVPGPAGTPATEWVLARKGNLVVGIGDESFALKGDLPLDKQPEVRLSKDEKIAKLRSLLVK
jgi:hypothetical protein